MSSNPQQQAAVLVLEFLVEHFGDPVWLLGERADEVAEKLAEAGLLVTPQASSAERSQEDGVCRCAPTPSAIGEDSAVYIRLSDRPVDHTTHHFNESVHVDMDDYDEPVGVEILGAMSVEIDGIEVSRD